MIGNIRRKSTLTLAVVFPLLLVSCGPSDSNGPAKNKSSSEMSEGVSNALPLSKAEPYKVIAVRDISFIGRKRFSATITAPLAKTSAERAQTALKAAIDIQKEKSADVVGVVLEISSALAGHGFGLATANYAPDGGGLSGERAFENGTWEAQTTNYNASSKEIHVAELWYANGDQFQIDDGFGGMKTDEPALKKYLARKLKTRASDVSLLPLMNTITTRHTYSDTAE